MSKALLVVVGMLLLSHNSILAQRSCGAEMVRANIIAKHPEAAAMFQQQRASLQGIADRYKEQRSAPGSAAKSTGGGDGSVTIPVIFHIVVSTAEYNQLGGDAGIQQRCDSQIMVLNQDYNRQNADSVIIPAGWKPLYASVGIHFALAHTAPNGNGTPGYEVKITSTEFSEGPNSYSDVKHLTSDGLDAWDETKYMNIWCLNFSDYPTLLGVTVPRSDIAFGTPADEVGVCINYAVLGKRAKKSDYYIPTGVGSNYYDKGRTLTHEIGHFFEIWHTWGDDGGGCPGSGGTDDGIADTPPEADHKYGMPAFTITDGTVYDACKDSDLLHKQPYGVGSLDFMNYTDDTAMQLFTPDQAAVMFSQVAKVGSVTGENYSLSQHPEVLAWPSNAGVALSPLEKALNIYPNPSSGQVYINVGSDVSELTGIVINDVMGRQVWNLNTSGNPQDYYSMDLSGMSKGIYFVRCNFAPGSITRKILLQ